MAAPAAVAIPVQSPGMMVMVAVPPGMGPGQQLQVDPDGPQGPLPPVTVTIPDGVTEGQQFQVSIPGESLMGAPLQAGVPPSAANFQNLTPLDFMLGSSEFIAIKQNVDLFEALVGFESQNQFKILGTNPYIQAQGRTGAKIGKAYENSDCLIRQCCGPSRPCEIRIRAEYDDFGMGEDMDVLTIDRPFRFQSPCCCNLQEVTVSKMANARDADQRVLGYIREQCSCTGPVFNVDNASGETLFTIEGPCCHCDGPCCEVIFEIKRGEEVVGTLTKEKGGMMKQMLSDADAFSLQFPPGCNVEVKSVLLGAVFLIDFMFFEKQGSGGAMGGNSMMMGGGFGDGFDGGDDGGD